MMTEARTLSDVNASRVIRYWVMMDVWGFQFKEIILAVIENKIRENKVFATYRQRGASKEITDREVMGKYSISERCWAGTPRQRGAR